MIDRKKCLRNIWIVPKEKTDITNVFGILASKEVPDKASLENYSIELAQKLDARKTPTDELASAPFKQLKRSELDDKSKGKITLKRREDRTDIKTRQREVMPLPPYNYNGLKVQEINLTESMEIQKQQEHRVKDARIQNALDKLLVPGTSKKVNFEKVSPDMMRYRENNEEEDEFEEEENSHPHSHSMEPQDSDDDWIMIWYVFISFVINIYEVQKMQRINFYCLLFYQARFELMLAGYFSISIKSTPTI